jgi:hypothetical protein
MRIESIMSLQIVARANGNDIGSATGFVATSAGRSYLVTNWHVVTGRDPEDGKPRRDDCAVPTELLIKHNHVKDLGWWVDRVEPLYDANDDPLWQEHPAHGRKVDVVALPLTRLEEVAAHAYDPSDPGDPIAIAPTEQASIVGFPFGITTQGTAIWVQGTIASEPEIDFGGLPCLLVDSRTREGQSGSPVLLYRGSGNYSGSADSPFGGSMVVSSQPARRLIGVYSGRIRGDSDLGYVWRTDALVDILDGGKRGPVPTVGPLR